MLFSKYRFEFKYIFVIFILIFYFNLLNLITSEKSKTIIDNKKRVGTIGFFSDTNIGNNLLKYSMYVILKNFGFKPTLISLKTRKNIYFLRKYLDIKEITNYKKDLKEKDFDILVANSDQIWSQYYDRLLEVGFLSFAENWNVSKFVYGASLAHDFWNPPEKVINSARKLVKQFSGISVREPGSVEIIKKRLGVEPNFVLDPTLLLSKIDYLKIINNYKINKDLNKKYLCIYILDKSKIINDFIEKVNQELKYNIINISLNGNDYIENFIFSINICSSMITDSFHGTIFSIIFEKPFMAFVNIQRGNARFFSLNQIFELKDRIVFKKKFEKKDIEILQTFPKINMTKFQILKQQSLLFIKKNLGLN